jgi:GTP-binding protein EngB required for normal cell division
MASSFSSILPLESADTKRVLDIIDELRSQGISKYVDLPQIIVCGEQSSGKSSVLEALSGMPFPTKDTVCTRFATEVILRHHRMSTQIFSIVKSSIPEQREEQARIEVLEKVEGVGQVEGVGHVARNTLADAIEKAKPQMGIRDGGKTFSSDILRVELSGPDHPNLTLVDLPGLYQAGSKSQSDADAEVVTSLVSSYMKNERSIILAVVSAKNDFNNQVITSLARRIDPLGQRTLGLITKPDTLHPGSESEGFYVRLAQNNEVSFKLGWHVLRNRDYPERNLSLTERNGKEKEFFEKGVWTAVHANHLGVDYLKERLSEVLRDHIISQLPSVIQQIDDGLRECRAGLASLGASRSTVNEQRRYLLDVSRRFNERLKDAIDGTYTHPFFGDATSEHDYRKRLRAVIQNTLTTFAEDIRERGHTYDIQEDDTDDEFKYAGDRHGQDESGSDESGSDHSSNKDDQNLDSNGIESTVNNQEETAAHKVKKITREVYLLKATSRLRRSRGRELSGLFDPLFVGDLFREQCRPWKGLVTECIKVIINATYKVLDTVLGAVSDEDTKIRVLSLLIDPEMDKIKCEVDAKMAAILHSHFVGHPITYNNKLTEIVQDMQQERRERELKRAFNEVFGNGWLVSGKQTYTLDTASFKRTISSQLEVGMEAYATSCATDFMQAYYQVCPNLIPSCRYL